MSAREGASLNDTSGQDQPPLPGGEARQAPGLRCAFCGADISLLATVCSACGKVVVDDSTVPLPALAPGPGTQGYVPPWVRGLVPSAADPPMPANTSVGAVFPPLPEGDFFGDVGIPPALVRVQAEMEADRRARTHQGEGAYVPPWLREDAQAELPPIPELPEAAGADETVSLQKRAEAAELGANTPLQAWTPPWLAGGSNDDSPSPPPVEASASGGGASRLAATGGASAVWTRVWMALGASVVVAAAFFASKEFDWPPRRDPVAPPAVPSAPVPSAAEGLSTPAPGGKEASMPPARETAGGGSHADKAPAPATPAPLAQPAPRAPVDNRTAKAASQPRGEPSRRQTPKRPPPAEPDAEAATGSQADAPAVPQGRAAQPTSVAPADGAGSEREPPRSAPSAPLQRPAPAPGGDPERDSRRRYDDPTERAEVAARSESLRDPAAKESRSRTPSEPRSAPPRSDKGGVWVVQLRRDLEKCGGQAFFKRTLCLERARWKHCWPDRWGTRPECVVADNGAQRRQVN